MSKFYALGIGKDIEREIFLLRDIFDPISKGIDFI